MFWVPCCGSGSNALSKVCESPLKMFVLGYALHYCSSWWSSFHCLHTWERHGVLLLRFVLFFLFLWYGAWETVFSIGQHVVGKTVDLLVESLGNEDIWSAFGGFKTKETKITACRNTFETLLGILKFWMVVDGFARKNTYRSYSIRNKTSFGRCRDGFWRQSMPGGAAT